MRVIVALLLLAQLAACSQPRRPAAIACEAPDGAPRARMIFFGEMHGSVEAPELVGRVACASALREATALGLEIPTGEQAAIDRYLASDGSDAARSELLSGDFDQLQGWSFRMATVALIEQVRVWATAGPAVDAIHRSTTNPKRRATRIWPAPFAPSMQTIPGGQSSR